MCWYQRREARSSAVSGALPGHYQLDLGAWDDGFLVHVHRAPIGEGFARGGYR
jgi:hypothetical protein